MTTTHDLNLPDKLSDVILIALEDLRKTEKDKRYQIDMTVYHKHDPCLQASNKCHVCFAGVIMAQCKSTTPKKDYEIFDFGPDKNKLAALDSIRHYSFEWAFKHFFHKTDSIFEIVNLSKKHKKCVKDLEDYFYDTDKPHYHENPTGFKHNMETVASILQEHGL